MKTDADSSEEQLQKARDYLEYVELMAAGFENFLQTQKEKQ